MPPGLLNSLPPPQKQNKTNELLTHEVHEIEQTVFENRATLVI